MHSIITRRAPGLAIAATALTMLLAGSAQALPGKKSVDRGDLQNNVVRSKTIANGQVKGVDVAFGAIGSEQVADESLTGQDVQNDSLTGDDIDESSLNVGGGGATIVSFSKRLSANDSQTKAIGNFTVRSATNGAGTCGTIELQSGNLDSQRSIGLNAAFANLAANSTAPITAANRSQAFTGVSDDGSSAVSGVVGRAQQGGTCLLSCYLTGN